MFIGCGTPVAAKASTEFAIRSTARPSRRIANNTPLASNRPTTPTQKPVGNPKKRGGRSPRTSATSQLPVASRTYTHTGSFDSAQFNARSSRLNGRARINATTENTSAAPRCCRTAFSISRTCTRSAEAGGRSGETRKLRLDDELARSTSFRAPHRDLAKDGRLMLSDRVQDRRRCQLASGALQRKLKSAQAPQPV